jgi:tetratricopeptide (TPR) repeat protein
MKKQAFVLCVGLVCLVGAQVAMAESRNANSPDSEKAARRFQQAVELYREGSYEGALAEFRKAYQISPSYRVLYNIAQTQFALHDFVGAYKSLLQYVSEGGNDISADRRAQVDEMSAKLEERIGHLQIATNAADADIRIDDVSVGTSPLPGLVAVNVGTHKVSAVKAGSPEAVRTITVAGKESVRIDLKIDEAVAAAARVGSSAASSPVSGPLSAPAASIAKSQQASVPGHTGLIVSLSTTAALAIGTGVAGYLALAAQQKLKDQINTYPNTKANIEDARSKSKHLGYITDALGAATVVSGGVALYYVLTSASATPKAKPGKASVEPIVFVPTLGGMVLQGSF